MDLAAIRTAIKDRLNYTSSSTDTRLLNSINRIYREVGTSIGLSFARQTNTSKVVTIANADVTFTATEKVLQVWYLTGSVPMILDEILNTEMRERVAPSSDKPTQWALVSTASNTVKIRLNAKPATAYTLYADVIQEISDLGATDEPTFPESFHDIIIEGVLRDEYRKQEKLALARDSDTTYQRRLSDLRMFMAKSAYLNIQQGKHASSQTSSGAGGGSASQSVTGAASSTDNAVARWNGTGGTSIQNSTVIINDTDDITMASTGTLTLPNTGLHLLDSNASHDLIIKPGSNITADRTLTVTTGDADRTLTISASVTLDQDVATTSDVNFNTVGINDSDDSHQLVLLTTSNLTADRNLTLVPGDAARTVTIGGDTTISQDYSTAGSPTFTGLTLTGALAEQGNGTITGSLTFDGDALHIFDTDASHDLIITPGSNLTADRVLTLTTGDAARTLTISANVTLDQDVATTSDVNFNTVGINDSNDSHQLILLTTSDLSADRNLTLVPGDAARTITISGDATISQDYSTAGSPQFTGIELGHASDTTLTRVSAGVVAIEGNTIYRVGGTDVALADGGTGASLTDPNADRILFWDDSAGQTTWLTAGSGLSLTDTTLTATASNIYTLLKANSGTDTNAAAANVDTVAISGLTAKDTLEIFVSAGSTTQLTATVILQNSTDAVTLQSSGGQIDAGGVLQMHALVRQRQTAATAILSFVSQSRNGINTVNDNTPAFTTAWTGAWTLALRHGGVTAGGTFDWSWAVYKIAGQ